MTEPEPHGERGTGISSAWLEREVKLEAGDLFRFPDLAGVADGGEVVRLADQRLEAIYVDTPDLQLARSGITLRHRTETQGGTEQQLWTLKLPSDADGVTLARHEITWPGGPEEVPPEAVRLVRARTLGSALEPVARLTTRRRRLELRDAAGELLAEIDDDRVDVMIGGQKSGRFREIEVELAGGVPATVAAAVTVALTGAGATAGSPKPKLVRALGAAAEKPPDVVVPELGREAPVAELVRASIARALTSLVSHEPGIRLGGDIEHVHKARVATRRLRSDLRTFRPLLDPEWVGRTRDELRWAGSALGGVRDADVLLDRLCMQAATRGLEREPGSAQLLDVVSAERSAAHAALLEALDSDRYLALLSSLRDGALEPPLGATSPDAPAGSVAPGLVGKAWEGMRRSVDALGKDPSDAGLHEVRKRAKALRYAAEAVTPVVGKPGALLAVRAEAVQEVLGELQDAVTAQAWLEKHARGAGAQVALVAGQLIEHQRARQAGSRASWREAWKKLRNKKVRAWLG
jgi:CHAD domain-containing protein